MPNRNVGVIVLTNETNVGLPLSIGGWTLDRILGNPKVDYVVNKASWLSGRPRGIGGAAVFPELAGKLFRRVPEISVLIRVGESATFGAYHVWREHRECRLAVVA